MIDRIAPRFARYEPLRHAAEMMAGMVSGLDRKNCWTIAEHRGEATPEGLQHLLSRAKWDAEAVRDDLRDYVIDAFGDANAILVLDETGDVKKGVHSVGVQRQYTGTAGRIENAQVAVYLTYAAPRGHALIDRALYLPRCWAEDPHRCDDAGIPENSRGFATKPTLAAALVNHAISAKVPAAWVAGDEVYGADPRLRTAIRGHHLGYVLAVAANRRMPTAAGPIRADKLPAQLPKRAWQKHSAGVGTDVSYCPSCNRGLGCSRWVMELRWSAWSLGVMMPVGPDTVGLLGVFAGRGPADGWVEVPGFGDAATAFGFDLLSPGDAQPVAGAAAGGEFAGLDPVVDDAGAAAEPVRRPQRR